jgi:hypothetical protein
LHVIISVPGRGFPCDVGVTWSLRPACCDISCIPSCSEEGCIETICNPIDKGDGSDQGSRNTTIGQWILPQNKLVHEENRGVTDKCILFSGWYIVWQERFAAFEMLLFVSATLQTTP